MTTWIQALRKWNQEKVGERKWCIPRKGSLEYVEVRAIMDGPLGKPKKLKPEAPEREEKEVTPAKPVDTRPYAKAPGVASALKKLEAVAAETKARNIARKAAAPKPGGAAAEEAPKLGGPFIVDGHEIMGLAPHWELYAVKGKNVYQYFMEDGNIGDYVGRFVPGKGGEDDSVDESKPELKGGRSRMR